MGPLWYSLRAALRTERRSVVRTAVVVAVLRSLGADRRWVTGVLHWHATVFIAMVTLVAGPLGVAAGGLAYRRVLAEA